jgi:Ca-activated chloride channel family protein
MAAHTDIMDTTYADMEDGKRHDIAVEVITRRTIDCDGDHVHRLLVADQSGEQFTILATPDSGALLGPKTGATHRISGLVGAVPVTSADDIGAECSDCGGQLRPGQVVDAVVGSRRPRRCPYTGIGGARPDQQRGSTR